MKNIYFSFFLLIAGLISCKEDELESSQDLYDQVSGEWNITEMTFPANDSTVTVNGQAKFEACEAQNNGCEGYFFINNEMIEFTYQVNPYPDIFSKIEMGPVAANRDNGLSFQRGGYDILTIDKNHLTIDLAFCTDGADGSCVTIHRHLIMTR